MSRQQIRSYSWYPDIIKLWKVLTWVGDHRAIEENARIQTTKGPNGDVVKTEDPGKTGEDILDDMVMCFQ
jgi:hypothetical protein